MYPKAINISNTSKSHTSMKTHHFLSKMLDLWYEYPYYFYIWAARCYFKAMKEREEVFWFWVRFRDAKITDFKTFRLSHRLSWLVNYNMEWPRVNPTKVSIILFNSNKCEKLNISHKLSNIFHKTSNTNTCLDSSFDRNRNNSC